MSPSKAEKPTVGRAEDERSRNYIFIAFYWITFSVFVRADKSMLQGDFPLVMTLFFHVCFNILHGAKKETKQSIKLKSKQKRVSS